MKSRAASFAVRLLAGAALMVVGGTSVSGAYAQAPQAASTAVPQGPGSLSGIWENAHYIGTGQAPELVRAIKTIDGKEPPFLPWAAKLFEKRIADAAKGNIFANSLAQCLPGGTPEMLWGAPYPVQVLETPGQVTELFEEQNHFRIILLNAKHTKDPDPSYMGESVGHWEGDTLVVDTIGLNDKTTLDMVGTPHTDKLHVIERYRRVAPDRIEILVTIDDPGAYSRPWQTKAYWRASDPGTTMAEYICANNENGADQNGFQSFGPPGGQ